MDSRFTNMEPRRAFVGHLWYPLRRIDIFEILTPKNRNEGNPVLIQILFKTISKSSFFSLQKGGDPTTAIFGRSISMKKPGSVGAGGAKSGN